tara:strand:- start:223 stop:1242 length:1020 start_codon:yes stop_codon:yes gene_type:complete
MKIAFWGTPNFAVPSLEALYKSENDIVCVITQPDKRRGRRNSQIESPIKKKAIELSIPIITSQSIKNDIRARNKILKYKPDIFIVVAYGQILPNSLLTIPILGSWNSHASLLPKWRGAAPIQWSILNGDEQTGIGIMQMEEGLDTGPVLIEEKVTIGLNDNYLSVSEKLSHISAKLLLETIEIIKKSRYSNTKTNLSLLKLTCQKDKIGKITYARQIEKKDLNINFNSNCIDIHKKVMALYPNSYIIYKGKVLKLESTEPLAEKYSLEITPEAKSILDNKIKYKNILPGTVIEIVKDIGIIVQCMDYPILIKKAKLEGKKSNFGKSLIQQLSIIKGYRF